MIQQQLGQPVTRLAVAAPFVPGTWRARVRLGGTDSRGAAIDGLVTGEPVTWGLAPGAG